MRGGRTLGWELRGTAQVLVPGDDGHVLCTAAETQPCSLRGISFSSGFCCPRRSGAGLRSADSGDAQPCGGDDLCAMRGRAQQQRLPVRCPLHAQGAAGCPAALQSLAEGLIRGGHLRVRASLGVWGSGLRPEDSLSPLRALSPCQEPSCSPELLGRWGWGGGEGAGLH